MLLHLDSPLLKQFDNFSQIHHVLSVRGDDKIRNHKTGYKIFSIFALFIDHIADNDGEK